MARENHILGEDLKTLLNRNSTMFTIFAVLLIVVSGVSIIDNPANWWVSAVSLIGFCAVVFLFMNARVLIKTLVAIFILSFLGSYAFKLGAILDEVGLGGSIWMTTLIATFFLSLAISYYKPSGKSRWGVVGLTTCLNFITTLGLSALNIDVKWAAIASSIFSLIVFNLLYYYTKNSRFKADKMPVAALDDTTAEKIVTAAIESGRGGWKKTTKNNTSAVIWNDEAAFQLLEVDFTQKLGIGGSKRRSYLTHQSENINPWLLQLIYKMLPFKGIKNADLMLVLLDSQNKNGNTAKVIGVEVPDSKKKIPVGILPSKHLMSDSKHEKLLKTIEEEFSDYALKLTAKQLDALDSHLPAEEDTGSEEASETVKV